jgi:hypothetical protein
MSDAISKALKTAFELGKTYWMQADSQSFAEQRRSDETFAKFRALESSTLQALQSGEPSRAMLDAVTHGTGITKGGKHVPLEDFYAQQSGEPVVRDDAPSNSLPSYKECRLRVENTKYVEERIKAGGFGFDDDGLYASQLHKFIYEYDDADPYKSAWFLHRLELLINEITSANTAPQPVVDTVAVIDFLKTAQNHCALNFSVSAERCIKRAIDLLSAGKETAE